MSPDLAIHVLVVEDDFLNRLHAVTLVEDAGFTAVEASNADEAIAILERRKDKRIVFTDIDCRAQWMASDWLIRKRWPPIELIVLPAISILVTPTCLSGR